MQRILCALDGSPNERNVLGVAVALARKLGGKLTLFHAVSLPMPLPPAALAMPPDDVGIMLADEARAHLAELVRDVPPELLARVQVEIGVPWRAVCDAAEADKADLVVVGSHGYGGVDRLIGTTAAKIVNHARCSVLVARAPFELEPQRR